jgi:hypothetical protein
VPAVLTVIQEVVAPVFHKYPDAPVGTHNTVDPPKHIDGFPVMTHDGLFVSVTSTLHTLTQLLL